MVGCATGVVGGDVPTVDGEPIVVATVGCVAMVSGATDSVVGAGAGVAAGEVVGTARACGFAVGFGVATGLAVGAGCDAGFGTSATTAAAGAAWVGAGWVGDGSVGVGTTDEEVGASVARVTASCEVDCGEVTSTGMVGSLIADEIS